MADNPEQTLADRMYPSMAKTPAAPVPPADSPAAEAPSSPAKLPPSGVTVPEGLRQKLPDPPERVVEQLTVDALIDAEDIGEAELSGAAVVPDEPSGYDARLGEVFDSLQTAARHDGQEDDAAALMEGRAATRELLHELQVPATEAGEIARTLGAWHGREPLTEDQRLDAKDRTIAQLEAKWGATAEARVQLARKTAEDACRRLPWLADLLRAGAGSSPELIEQFAQIGLRQARKARRK